MSYVVVVSFGSSAEFEFKFSDEDVQAVSREDASHWLRSEFEAMECTPRNPIGKLLLLDIVLDVAKYAGEARFAAGSEWARHFALCSAATLGRNTIHIDVPNLVVR